MADKNPSVFAAMNWAGLSGSVRYTPREDGPGAEREPGFDLGCGSSGVNALWSREHASGLAQGAEFEAGQRFQAELGYGLEGSKGRALWAPFLAADASGGGSQALRFGLKMTSGKHIEAGLEVGPRGSERDTIRRRGSALDGELAGVREASRAAISLNGSIRC